MIGSLRWRLKNYGFFPSIKYIYEKLNSKKKILNQNEYSQIEDLLNSVGLNNSDFDLDLIRQEIEIKFNKLKNDLQNAKIKNVFDNPSFTRVIILAILIKSKKFKLIIESGTQNGISTSLIKSISEKLKTNIEIVSFDVVEHIKIIEPNVKYIVLSQPVRREFKNESLKLNGINAIFFHDSDHSKENMEFEFNWAWNKMKVPCILSDDVENNYAFNKFCKKNKIHPLYFKLDKGPLVGLVLRN
jgi:hypothetical protein